MTTMQILRDQADTRRELMEQAITGMLNPREHIEDLGNPFQHLSVKRIAEESVRLQHGLNIAVPLDKVCKLAMQTTSDFAAVLENVANKQLLQAYQAASPTYKIWTKPSTTPDFKSMTRVRLGEIPEFLKVPEGGQITIGLMADSKETYSLATYGRGVSFTRQMLINDDLNAFNTLIQGFGQAAARLENKAVYAILYANANMADSQPLFILSPHANLGTGQLGNTALGAMFAAMAGQVGIDGVTVLNITPRFLIVPKSLEATARSTTMLVGPSVAASSQNWFAGRLEVVADSELDTNGSGGAIWYGRPIRQSTQASSTATWRARKARSSSGRTTKAASWALTFMRSLTLQRRRLIGAHCTKVQAHSLNLGNLVQFSTKSAHRTLRALGSAGRFHSFRPVNRGVRLKFHRPSGRRGAWTFQVKPA